MSGYVVGCTLSKQPPESSLKCTPNHKMQILLERVTLGFHQFLEEKKGVHDPVKFRKPCPSSREQAQFGGQTNILRFVLWTQSLMEQSLERRLVIQRMM